MSGNINSISPSTGENKIFYIVHSFKIDPSLHSAIGLVINGEQFKYATFGFETPAATKLHLEPRPLKKWQWLNPCRTTRVFIELKASDEQIKAVKKDFDDKKLLIATDCAHAAAYVLNRHKLPTAPFPLSCSPLASMLYLTCVRSDDVVEIRTLDDFRWYHLASGVVGEIGLISAIIYVTKICDIASVSDLAWYSGASIAVDRLINGGLSSLFELYQNCRG